MSYSDKTFVKCTLFNEVSRIFDIREASDVLEKIFEDVVTDIEETADRDFNSSDVRLALQRVLYSKIMN